ncbi:hypothetical protein CsatB_001987 [Cannabis sativa]
MTLFSTSNIITSANNKRSSPSTLYIIARSILDSSITKYFGLTMDHKGLFYDLSFWTDDDSFGSSF